METIKNLFGVMFLAVTAWLLSRNDHELGRHADLGYSLFVGAWVLWRGFKPGTSARLVGRALSAAFGVYGAVLLVGAVQGSTNPLAPFTKASLAQQQGLEFKRIKTLADLEREVAAAKAAANP